MNFDFDFSRTRDRIIAGSVGAVLLFGALGAVAYETGSQLIASSSPSDGAKTSISTSETTPLPDFSNPVASGPRATVPPLTPVTTAPAAGATASTSTSGSSTASTGQGAGDSVSSDPDMPPASAAPVSSATDAATLRAFDLGANQYVHGVSNDGTRIVVWDSPANSYTYRNLATGTSTAIPGSVRTLSLSGDGQTVISLDNNGNFHRFTPGATPQDTVVVANSGAVDYYPGFPINTDGTVVAYYDGVLDLTTSPPQFLSTTTVRGSAPAGTGFCGMDLGGTRVTSMYCDNTTHLATSATVYDVATHSTVATRSLSQFTSATCDGPHGVVSISGTLLWCTSSTNVLTVVDAVSGQGGSANVGSIRIAQLMPDGSGVIGFTGDPASASADIVFASQTGTVTVLVSGTTRRSTPDGKYYDQYGAHSPNRHALVVNKGSWATAVF